MLRTTKFCFFTSTPSGSLQSTINLSHSCVLPCLWVIKDSLWSWQKHNNFSGIIEKKKKTVSYLMNYFPFYGNLRKIYELRNKLINKWKWKVLKTKCRSTTHPPNVGRCLWFVKNYPFLHHLFLEKRSLQVIELAQPNKITFTIFRPENKDKPEKCCQEFSVLILTIMSRICSLHPYWKKVCTSNLSN